MQLYLGSARKYHRSTLKGSKQKHEVLRFSSRRETPRSHVLNFRATSGHNVLYMRNDVSKEISCFRLPSSGRRRLLLKDVHAHCYCASLVRTLYMTWHAPRHVFQARAQSPNSTKYRADDLCGNLICEYFCWMLGDPHFFPADHFLLHVGSFNYFSYTIQIGSNW